LIESDRELGPAEIEKISNYLAERHVRLTMIQLKENRSALIVKTDVEGAAETRERCPELKVGGKPLRTTLVSGSIGKLKRRVRGGRADVNVEVHE